MSKTKLKHSINDEIVTGITFTVSELWGIASDLQRAEDRAFSLNSVLEEFDKIRDRINAKAKIMKALKRITEEKIKEQNKY